jgi:hypothetical protein
MEWRNSIGEKDDSHRHIDCCGMPQRCRVPREKCWVLSLAETQDFALKTQRFQANELLALRQQNRKRRSRPFLTFNGNGSLVLFNNALDDRQP